MRTTIARSGPATLTTPRQISETKRHSAASSQTATTRQPARSGAGRARTLRVELQFATQRPWVPGPVSVRRWARAALDAGIAGLPARQKRLHDAPGQVLALCVRVVGSAESRRLDRDFRGKDKPTNVLSFPASQAERENGAALGDLVICAPVVAREAREQHKAIVAHWAHMVVHGTLHLLGYDHEATRPARRMERLEVEILRGLGFHDPYLRVTQDTV